MIPCQYQAPTKKRVQFEASVTVQPIDCRATEEEKSRAYYNEEELETISFNAKAIRAASKQRLDASSDPGQQQPQSCLLNDPSLRGFELHLCPDRLRNKVVATKTILKYQRNLNASNKTSQEKLVTLGAISAKVNQWSRQIGLATAQHDSLQVYGCDYVIPITKTAVDAASVSPFPVPVKKNSKRRRITTDNGSRPCIVNHITEPSNAVKRRRVSDWWLYGQPSFQRDDMRRFWSVQTCKFNAWTTHITYVELLKSTVIAI